MQILNQLGGLFLEAVPTAIIVFLFFLFLRWSFFRPIEAVLAKRKSLIEGSRQASESLRAQAAEKNRAYEQALRKARTEILNEQESARRVALDERSAAIQQARGRANEEIVAARKRVAAEIQAARGELESTGLLLAEEIAASILAPRPVTPRPAGEA